MEVKFNRGAKRGAKGVIAIRMVLSHETHCWIATERAKDKRNRSEKPTMSHIAEALCWQGLAKIAEGERPVFVEKKTRGKFAEISALGKVQELYCPADLFKQLQALHLRVNAGQFDSIPKNKKGVSLANVAATLIEIAQ